MHFWIKKPLNQFVFFPFLAGIISLLDEEEPQLKVRTGCRVVDQVPEDG